MVCSWAHSTMLAVRLWAAAAATRSRGGALATAICRMSTTPAAPEAGVPVVADKPQDWGVQSVISYVLFVYSWRPKVWESCKQDNILTSSTTHCVGVLRVFLKNSYNVKPAFSVRQERPCLKEQTAQSMLGTRCIVSQYGKRFYMVNIFIWLMPHQYLCCV